MDKSNDSLETLQLKYSILNGDKNTSFVKIKVNKFKRLLNEAIKSGQDYQDVFKDKEYHREYDKVAYNILSSSPFSSNIHICKSLRCSQDTLLQWIDDNELFDNSISQGFIEGEVLARELLLECAFEPSSKVNTNLIKILSDNVYSIKEQVAENKDELMKPFVLEPEYLDTDGEKYELTKISEEQ